MSSLTYTATLGDSNIFMLSCCGKALTKRALIVSMLVISLGMRICLVSSPYCRYSTPKGRKQGDLVISPFKCFPWLRQSYLNSITCISSDALFHSHMFSKGLKNFSPARSVNLSRQIEHFTQFTEIVSVLFQLQTSGLLLLLSYCIEYWLCKNAQYIAVKSLGLCYFMLVQ